MMSYGTGDKNSTVYSSAGLCFQMLLYPEVRDCLQFDKTILDPAVGEGQFPCAALVLKFFYNLEQLDEDSALRALKSLYGIDLAGVDKAKQHLRQTLADAFKYFTGREFSRWLEADIILDENFLQGDSFKLLKLWAQPQLSLFEVPCHE